MIENYLSIKETTINEIIIEKSKFIANIVNIKNEEAAKNFIAKISREHFMATHNCYAYVLGLNNEIQKFSDDKEPSGTAGIPILETIKSKQIKNCAVVVTRYFGGIKLGSGGLARAYSSSCREVILKSKIVKYELCRHAEIVVDYEKFNLLFKFLENNGIKILKTEFNLQITVNILVLETQFKKVKQSLINYFNGNIKLFDKNIDYYTLSD